MNTFRGRTPVGSYVPFFSLCVMVGLAVVGCSSHNPPQVSFQMRPVASVSAATKSVCNSFDDANPAPAASLEACDADSTRLFTLGPAFEDSGNVVAAFARDSFVVIEFDADGQQSMEAETARMSKAFPPANQAAFVVDGVVVYAFDVQVTITGGRATLELDSPAEAQLFANRMNG